MNGVLASTVQKVSVNKLVTLAVGCVILGAGSAAWAQEAPVAAVVEGGGVKVGEGTVIHPIIGIETGVVSNVFYESNNTNLVGLLKIIGELALGSLPAERMQASSEQDDELRNFGDLAFRAWIHTEYNEYLSSNDNVQAQRDLGLQLSAQGIVFPKRTLQFAFSDDFRREIRPVNFESSEDVDRDINRIGLQLRYRPRNRTLHGSLQYTNVIDYFEDESQQFANRIQHSFGVTASWQWLPITRVYADASIGVFDGLGSESTRPTSFPLRVNLGIASALTVKTSLNARVGFAKGFYETGPDFTNITTAIQFGYRFSPQARFAAAYTYDFEDSINANFYRDHAFKVRMEHRLDRFAFSAGAEVRLRQYRGIISEVMTTETDRNDLIFAAPLGAIYNFRNWIAATLDYQVQIVQTDFRYNPDMNDPLDDPSYVRQSLMLGVRAAY